MKMCASWWSWASADAVVKVPTAQYDEVNSHT